MYCINCRYYNNSMCLNRDGIKSPVYSMSFCSYVEPIRDIDISCSNCRWFVTELNDTGFCINEDGLNQCVFKSDFCSCFEIRTIEEIEKPKVGWLYKNEDKGYIILEKINSRGLCEAYNYDENGEKLTYTLGINSLGEPIMQAFKSEVK